MGGFLLKLQHFKKVKLIFGHPVCCIYKPKKKGVCHSPTFPYAVHVTVALVGVATLNLALPVPPAISYHSRGLAERGQEEEEENEQH